MNGKIDINYIPSANSVADLITKALVTTCILI